MKRGAFSISKLRVLPILYTAILLMVLGSAFALHSVIANLIPVQGYETLTVPLNLSISNFGSQDVVTLLNLSIAPLNVLSMRNYAGWNELNTGSNAIWQDGTLESNIIMALYEFTTMLPIVTADTTYNLTLETKDDQGFIQQTLIQFIVQDDATGPVLTVLSPQNGMLVRQGTTNLLAEATAFDPETGVSNVSFNYGLCPGITSYNTLNQFGTTYNSTIDLSSFTDMQQVCYSIDAYNNGGTPTISAGMLTIDGSAPGITLSSPSNGQQINLNSLFRFIPDDNLAPNMTCDLLVDAAAVDTGIFNDATPSSFNVTNAAEGPHSWAIACADLVGLSNTSETRSYILDKTPPLVQLVGLSNGSFVRQNDIFWVNITDNFGLDSYWYEYAGVNVTPGSAFFSVSTFGWLEGIHTVKVYANDSASNSIETDFDLIVDLTAPASNLIAPDNISDVMVNFTINALDNFDPVLDCDIYLNGSYYSSGQVINGVDSGIIRFVLPGDYSWYAICRDDMNNSASSGSSLTFTVVDIAGPFITLSPISSVTRGNNVAITANITDYSSVASVSFSITDADTNLINLIPTQAGDFYTAILATTALSAAGTYNLVINALDTIGNPSSATASFDVNYTYIVNLALNPASTTPGNTVDVSGTALFDNSSFIPEQNITLTLPTGEVDVALVNGTFQTSYVPVADGTYTITASVTDLLTGTLYSSSQTLTVSTAANSPNRGSGNQGGAFLYKACGDRICQATESCSSCPADCGKCKADVPVDAKKSDLAASGPLEPVSHPAAGKDNGNKLGVDKGNGKKIGIVGMAAGWLSSENINWKGVGMVALFTLGLLGALYVLAGNVKIKPKPRKAFINKDINSYIDRIRNSK